MIHPSLDSWVGKLCEKCGKRKYEKVPVAGWGILQAFVTGTRRLRCDNPECGDVLEFGPYDNKPR